VAQLVLVLALALAAVVIMARMAPRSRPPRPRQPAIVRDDGSNNARASRPVNVNEATLAQLDELPYVSPKVAAAIIEGRPYARPEDLLRVRGIGPKVLERIRPHITMGEAAAPTAQQD
jgi:competence protein ComEA